MKMPAKKEEEFPYVLFMLFIGFFVVTPMISAIGSCVSGPDYGPYTPPSGSKQRGVENYLKEYGNPNLSDEQRSRDAGRILDAWDQVTK